MSDTPENTTNDDILTEINDDNLIKAIKEHKNTHIVAIKKEKKPKIYKASVDNAREQLNMFEKMLMERDTQLLEKLDEKFNKYNKVPNLLEVIKQPIPSEKTEQQIQQPQPQQPMLFNRYLMRR